MEPPLPGLSWLLTVAAIIVILASLTVDLYLLLRRQHRVMARGFYTKRIRTTFTCTLRVTSVPRDTKQVQRISNPETRRRLFEKYREREKRRVNHILHLASSIVAGISERYGGLYAVFGDLTEIRTHINKQHRSKRLRRRLNSWPFGRLQQLCEFKLLRNPRAGLAA